MSLTRHSLTVGTVASCLVVPYYIVVLSPIPLTAFSWLLQRLFGLAENNRRAVSLVLRYVIIDLDLAWLLSRIGLNVTGVATLQATYQLASILGSGS